MRFYVHGHFSVAAFIKPEMDYSREAEPAAMY